MLIVDDAWRMARQYLQTGQLAAGEQMLRYVLELNPRHVPALHNLGQLTYLNGNPGESVSLFERATQGEPGNADLWNDLAVACVRTGAFARAVTACEEAVRLRPDYANAYNNLGSALFHLGQHERAIKVLNEALRLNPDLADAHSNLGITLRAVDQLEESAQALGEAVRLNPKNADTANLAGMVYQRLGDLDRAQVYYRHALGVNPNYADALSNLATIYKEKGDLDLAVTTYRQVLQMQPQHLLAYYNLSELASDGRYRFPPEDVEDMRRLSANPQIPAFFRSVVDFALGAVLDAGGNYDEAFAYFRQANRLRHDWLRESGRAFDAGRHHAFVSDIIQNFDGAYFRSAAGAAPSAERPLFIVGMPRSGTTLVEHILASHPAVHGAGEVGDFPRIMAQLTGVVSAIDLAAPVPLQGGDVAREIAARHWRTLARFSGGASRVTVKLPENVFYLGLLATLFPGARVVYCRRDPRDVCLSCYFHNFQAMDYAFAFEDLAAYYQEYERLMEHWMDVLPIPVHEVCYEELIADQEQITRGLVGHCGLDWDERCLRFYDTRRVVQTASNIQVRKPLSRKPVGRWKNYEAHLAPLLDALKANQAEAGSVGQAQLALR